MSGIVPIPNSTVQCAPFQLQTMQNAMEETAFNTHTLGRYADVLCFCQVLIHSPDYYLKPPFD